MSRFTKDRVAIASRTPLTVDPCTEWMRDRACNGVPPSVFFPEVGQMATKAKAICASCPVASECLEFALANNEPHGVWGGLTPRERRAYPRGRRNRPVAVCGTLSGYTAHRRRGEETCERCRAANAAYQREHKAKVDREARNERKRELYAARKDPAA